MDLSFGVCAGGHPNVRSLYCCSAGNPRWIAFFSRQYCCLSGQRSHSIFANRIYRTFEALVEKKREGEQKGKKKTPNVNYAPKNYGTATVFPAFLCLDPFWLAAISPL